MKYAHISEGERERRGVSFMETVRSSQIIAYIRSFIFSKRSTTVAFYQTKLSKLH